MPEIVVTWDSRERYDGKSKIHQELRFPIDTKLRIDPAPEYCRLMHLVQGVWVELFTTPTRMHFEIRGYA